MSRTCHSTSAKTTIFREKQEMRRNPIKEKVLNVIVVRDLDTLDLNVLHIKKQKKGLSVSWYDDDDSEGELDDETTKHVTTFTGRCESNEDSWIEDVSYEELTDSYKELCTRSEEVCKIGEKQKRIITQLQAEEEKQLSTISSLQNEVTLLSSKVQNKTKFIRMLNNWSDMLDEILQVGKRTGNLKGIWFNYQSLNKLGKTPVTKFIPSKKEYELTMLDQMLQHPSRH